MKNILVIGGSYFLGRVFVEELARADAFSLCVVNRGNVPLNIFGVNEIVCDRNDVEGLKDKLPHIHWDAVVDFCGYAPMDIKNIFSVFKTNDSLTTKGADSSSQYIYISTTSIYKDTFDLPIRENSPKLTGPQPELGPQAANYAFDKWRSEQELVKQCRDLGFTYTCLRPAIIYGKYNYAPRESYFFDLINNYQIIILPDNDLALFQFVLVTDAAHIIRQCIGEKKAINRSFNLAGDDLVSYDRFVDVVKNVMDKRAAIRKQSIKSIDEQRIPLPFPLDKHLIYSGELIKKTLGFEYTPFEEGMRKTYEFYSQNSSR